MTVIKPAEDAAARSRRTLAEASETTICSAQKIIKEENKLDEGNAAAVVIENNPSHSTFPVQPHLGVFNNSAPPKPSSESMGVEMLVDEDEDEAGEEDDVSDLAECEALRQDLQDALDDSGFAFTGSFYHANILNNAPNPCLHISGLGLVGLPLSERDAKAVVSCATLAPFGHGERTVVDQDVRDTWEIEPARVAFGNPEWLEYIDGVVLLDICRALGVAIGNSPPKMELYKLLLYETGSHFLPHQDTQKANGMFATVVILLPSAYTGGQVVVSHASTTKTIDFAPNSLLSTAVLAWYTDVKHEVKPVTSGYRLALTYNLIHIASPGVVQPMLPQMYDSVDRLRRVLKRWRDGKYVEVPEMPLMAYLLDHEYSSLNLKDGFKALKGADAHLVAILRDIAEELGYMIGLASLERHVSGPADDCGDSYYRRNRRHYYLDSEDEDDFDSTPEMLEEEETTTSILGLVDLKGFSLLPFGKIGLEDCNLIPSDPFEGETPDKVEYEGYMGNGAGDVTHWYHRTVLVLMHKNDVDADMMIWINHIVSRSHQLNKEQTLQMLDLAMKWKTADLFKSIMKSSVCTLSVVNVDVLSKAWQLFSFEAVRSSFEQALARSPSFYEKMKLIYTVRSKMSNEDRVVVRPWCKKETDKVLASYTQPEVRDIPAILSVIRNCGWVPFVKILLPAFLKQPSYPFLIALIKALQEARQSLLDQLAKAKSKPKTETSTEAEPVSPADTAGAEKEISNGSQTDGKFLVDKIIKTALEVAAKQWSHAPPTYSGFDYTTGIPTTRVAQTAKIERIVEIIEQTIISANLDICRSLIIDVLKNTGTSAEKFTQIYSPLIPRLRALLQARNLDLCVPPFVDLFQIVIGTYLRDVLGRKGQHLNPRLRKIGCGCQDCQPLDKFILDPTTQTTIFRFVKKRRTHLERQINHARDLCTYQTVKYGTPHGLQVAKLPEVVQACTWDHRQKTARTFLSSIGTDEVIKQIMGERYVDVVAAINGTTPFGASKVSGDGISAATSKITPPASATQTGAPAVVAAANSSHAGTPSSRIASSRGATSFTDRKVVTPSTQAARPVLASTIPAQLAGKKRNLGFLDLT